MLYVRHVMATEVHEILGVTRDFIDLAKTIKAYVTPQYKSASKALYQIIDNFLLANQNLLKWFHDFEVIDLGEENR